ncbi:MAG: glutathione S-transferase family protein [Cyanobacteria bacterium J06623_7]
MAKSLPGKLIVKTGKFVWTTMWQVMMSQLAPRSKTGAYIRPESQFRNSIEPDPEHLYQPAANRYRLYVGMGCPWAHRTLVTRALKGLEEAISVSIVYPSPDAGIWVLSEAELGCNTVPELYQRANPGYQGRCTVPILWDDDTKTIVNNESAEIIEILNRSFNEFSRQPLELYPKEFKETIDRWNDRIYHAVNNGVYRCGFAQSQEAYDAASRELFTTLDEIEEVLATQRYLCGDRLTLADIRLFTTLFRFDIVYYGLFKCNLRRIVDYQHLSGYLQDIYQLPGVADTCDRESVKRDYYGNLFPLNPGGIIPLGPDISDLQSPHGRDKFG